MEILQYKDFEGSAQLDMERNVCRGKLLHIDDLVTYEAANIGDLRAQFQEAVDDYIETCKEIGKAPQKPYKGQFNVRIPPELHRAAACRATQNETSLNEVVVQALQNYLVSPPGSLQSLKEAVYRLTAGSGEVDHVAPANLYRFRAPRSQTTETGGASVKSIVIAGGDFSNAMSGSNYEH